MKSVATAMYVARAVAIVAINRTEYLADGKAHAIAYIGHASSQAIFADPGKNSL
jgi:hypothetical protein